MEIQLGSVVTHALAVFISCLSVVLLFRAKLESLETKVAGVEQRLSRLEKVYDSDMMQLRNSERRK